MTPLDVVVSLVIGWWRWTEAIDPTGYGRLSVLVAVAGISAWISWHRPAR